MARGVEGVLRHCLSRSLCSPARKSEESDRKRVKPRKPEQKTFQSEIGWTKVGSTLRCPGRRPA